MEFGTTHSTKGRREKKKLNMIVKLNLRFRVSHGGDHEV
jgi:hypothetical protein